MRKTSLNLLNKSKVFFLSMGTMNYPLSTKIINYLNRNKYYAGFEHYPYNNENGSCLDPDVSIVTFVYIKLV